MKKRGYDPEHLIENVRKADGVSHRSSVLKSQKQENDNLEAVNAEDVEEKLSAKSKSKKTDASKKNELVEGQVEEVKDNSTIGSGKLKGLNKSVCYNKNNDEGSEDDNKALSETYELDSDGNKIPKMTNIADFDSISNCSELNPNIFKKGGLKFNLEDIEEGNSGNTKKEPQTPTLKPINIPSS